MQEDDSATKLCRKCGKTKPVSLFGRHKKRGRQHWCKACFKKYFANRGDVHRKQSGAAHQARKARSQEHVRDILDASVCTDCSRTGNVILEFDHIDSTAKAANVSHLAANGAPLPAIDAEIAKCEIVCRNCHRMRTAERVMSWRYRFVTGDPSWWSQDGLRTRAAAYEREGRIRLAQVAAVKAGHIERNVQRVGKILDDATCADCGLDGFVEMDFDHVGPKTVTVIDAVFSAWSWERIEQEIAKCEIVCTNCHAIRTDQRRQARKATSATSR